MNFYGYKLHAVCSSSGVFCDFELTAAAVHDIHYLKNIKHNFSSCVLLGDKAYLSADYQLDLFISNNIRLEVPMRVNRKHSVMPVFDFMISWSTKVDFPKPPKHSESMWSFQEFLLE